MGPKALADVPSLATIFLSGISRKGYAMPPPHDELERTLAEKVREAQLAWPEFTVVPGDLVEYLATKRAADGWSIPALRALRVDDLYLACACSHGDERAIVLFVDRYFTAIDRKLARMGVPQDLADDVKSELREKLFFPKDGERSPLDGFSGRGDLGRWVRSVAVRASLKMLAARRIGYVQHDEMDIAVQADSPELAYLKTTFAAEFKSVLAEAVASFEPRERTLLRQHFLDGLSIDELGRLHRVHRATAARWLVDVRRELLKRVTKQLMERLRLNEADLENIMGLVRSQLDVSIHRLFRQTAV